MKKSSNVVIRDGYGATIFLTTLVFLILIICNKVYPFGDNSLLVYDGNDQYLNFYGYIQSFWSTGNNIFYSFNNVLGGNMFSASAYYMFSPFNLLLLILKKEHLLLGIHIIILLKHIFAAIAFCFCLNFFDRENIFEKIILSVCYGYIGYTVTFFMIPEWLDGIILLPVLTVGISKLVKDNSPSLYIICLTFAIISNYYIGFMLCIISVIFYIALVALYSEKFWKCLKDTICMFGISSFLAGGISAIVLFPVIMALPRERIQTDVKKLLDFKFNFEFPQLLFQLFGYGTGAEQISDGLPVLFFGLVPFLLVILFFLNKGIRYKEKIIAFILSCVFVFSFHNSLLNRIWHGMSHNSEFNYRYSFVFSFICLITAFISLTHLRSLEKKDFCKAGIVLLVGMVWVCDHFDEKSGDIPAIIPCIDLLLLGVALVVLIRYRNDSRKKYVLVLFSMLTLINIAEIGYLSIHTVMTDFEGAKQSEYAAFLSRMSASIEEIEDENYRSEKTFRRTHNDNMLLGMKGVSNYSSTENLEILKFVKDLGMNHEWMYAFYTRDVPASTDSLLGIKYILSDSDIDKAKYVLENEENGYKIYRNPYVLPLVMPAESILSDVSGLNGFEKINWYWKSLTNGLEKNIFDAKEILECEETLDEKNVMKVKVDNKNGMPLYLFMPYGKYVITVTEDEKTYDLGYDNEKFVYYLGRGQEVEMNIRAEKDADIPKEQVKIYAENETILEEYSNIVNSSDIRFEMINSSRLEGQYTSYKKNQYLVTTIPYDTGWRVTVDGEKVKLEKNWNAMLAFQVDEGKHSIVMKYVPRGFKGGCFVTIFSSALTIIYLCNLKGRKSNGL